MRWKNNFWSSVNVYPRTFVTGYFAERLCSKKADWPTTTTLLLEEAEMGFSVARTTRWRKIMCWALHCNTTSSSTLNVATNPWRKMQWCPQTQVQQVSMSKWGNGNFDITRIALSNEQCEQRARSRTLCRCMYVRDWLYLFVGLALGGACSKRRRHMQTIYACIVPNHWSGRN